ncbi:hypothetical protein TNCV_4645421 [Trichonephila clavipes]|nr:hypothetical protein TNCV_4645421 [Trichonephila clavipes]
MSACGKEFHIACMRSKSCLFKLQDAHPENLEQSLQHVGVHYPAERYPQACLKRKERLRAMQRSKSHKLKCDSSEKQLNANQLARLSAHEPIADAAADGLPSEQAEFKQEWVLVEFWAYHDIKAMVNIVGLIIEMRNCTKELNLIQEDYAPSAVWRYSLIVPNSAQRK